MQLLSSSRTHPRRRPAMAKRRAPTPRLRLEWLEERSLLSQFSLGALVQAAVTDPFAACKPGNQTGVYFPGTQAEPVTRRKVSREIAT